MAVAVDDHSASAVAGRQRSAAPTARSTSSSLCAAVTSRVTAAPGRQAGRVRTPRMPCAGHPGGDPRGRVGARRQRLHRERPSDRPYALLGEPAAQPRDQRGQSAPAPVAVPRGHGQRVPAGGEVGGRRGTAVLAGRAGPAPGRRPAARRPPRRAGRRGPWPARRRRPARVRRSRSRPRSRRRRCRTACPAAGRPSTPSACVSSTSSSPPCARTARRYAAEERGRPQPGQTPSVTTTGRARSGPAAQPAAEVVRIAVGEARRPGARPRLHPHRPIG